MDFEPSARAQETCARMWDFMHEGVFPAERVYHEWRATHDPHAHPPVMEELAAEARRRGLWNLFLPAESGLSNLDYASVAEVSGWSPVIAPEAINCQAPDTGNMETLHLFGTPGAEAAVARAAARGPHPLGVRHDRARGGQLRRDEHPRRASRATATTT